MKRIFVRDQINLTNMALLQRGKAPTKVNDNHHRVTGETTKREPVKKRSTFRDETDKAESDRIELAVARALDNRTAGTTFKGGAKADARAVVRDRTSTAWKGQETAETAQGQRTAAAVTTTNAREIIRDRTANAWRA